MNTLQVKQALERNTFTKKIFGGVFAADELPKIMNTFPCGFVANTDPSTEPGTAWVAFYFPSREKGEFFDSYEIVSSLGGVFSSNGTFPFSASDHLLSFLTRSLGTFILFNTL